MAGAFFFCPVPISNPLPEATPPPYFAKPTRQQPDSSCFVVLPISNPQPPAVYPDYFPKPQRQQPDSFCLPTLPRSNPQPDVTQPLFFARPARQQPDSSVALGKPISNPQPLVSDWQPSRVLRPVQQTETVFVRVPVAVTLTPLSWLPVYPDYINKAVARVWLEPCQGFLSPQTTNAATLIIVTASGAADTVTVAGAFGPMVTTNTGGRA